MKKQIEATLRQGIIFLKNEQKKDGGFKDYAWGGEKLLERSTTFSTALILDILTEINLEKAESIRANASEFLLAQASKNFTFNYWKRGSEEEKKLPFPDDLDDTCCAAASLTKYKKELIGGEALAGIINILTFMEKKVGGPYYTWIVPKETGNDWRDIDLAVNSNIAYFLSLNEVFLSSIDELIEKAIGEADISSPYYISEMAVPYFISRFYKGNKKNKLIEYIVKKKENGFENILDNALAASALLNLNYPLIKLEKSLKDLLSATEWERESFVIESNKEGKTMIAGSPALTCAFCLEVLNKYQKLKEVDQRSLLSQPSEEIFNKLIFLMEDRFKETSPSFKFFAMETITLIFRKQSVRNLVLLPYFFSSVLKENSLSEKAIIDLCYGQALGWVAYTIYDEFLDGDQDERKISIANLCLRELTTTFSNLGKGNLEIKKLFITIIDKIDTANFWETNEARIKIEKNSILINKLPDFIKEEEKISDKSLGLALGPLALLLLNGKKLNSKDCKNLLIFVRSYIKARQLCDDIHDWEEDLRKGILTKVVVSILKSFMHEKNKNVIVMENDLEKLREIFWYSLVEDICMEIKGDLIKAERALLSLNITGCEVFLNLLKKTENVVNKTLDERKRTMDFINNFTK